MLPEDAPAFEVCCICGDDLSTDEEKETGLCATCFSWNTEYDEEDDCAE